MMMVVREKEAKQSESAEAEERDAIPPTAERNASKVAGLGSSKQQQPFRPRNAHESGGWTVQSSNNRFLNGQ